jgi:hypothetical protein
LPNDILRVWLCEEDDGKEWRGRGTERRGKKKAALLVDEVLCESNFVWA